MSRFIALFALLTAVLTLGCGVTNARVLPKQALVVRAAMSAEPPTTARALDVVAFVQSQVGKPYCWGGNGPSCFDCSGLAHAAWSRVGARIPRTSSDIAATLPEIPLAEVRAGDILWWPGHVGIYVGYGWVVDALDARDGIVRRPASDPYRAFRPREELVPLIPPAIEWTRVSSRVP